MDSLPTQKGSNSKIFPSRETSWVVEPTQLVGKYSSPTEHMGFPTKTIKLVVSTPFKKIYISQNGFIFPKDRDENIEIFELPPPRKIYPERATQITNQPTGIRFFFCVETFKSNFPAQNARKPKVKN